LSPSSVASKEGTYKKISVRVSSGNLGGRKKKTCSGLPTKNRYVTLSVSRAYLRIVFLSSQRISLNKTTYKTTFLTRTPFCDTNLFLPIRLHRMALNQKKE
jgi:hypothetical protein